MTSTSCAGCRFFKPPYVDPDGVDDVGECRRNAPREMWPDDHEHYENERRWPATFGSDWCGEFEPRKRAEDQWPELEEMLKWPLSVRSRNCIHTVVNSHDPKIKERTARDWFEDDCRLARRRIRNFGLASAREVAKAIEDWRKAGEGG